ncbi:aminoacyl-tRNA hydrolase [Patescibacteria group bacterium]|nr:aminoacyl-tRNA hydrolase [Patescibacteria group bacterium]MBU0964450.1 aminoacyl-tRNA hydrolase [Patescibacteria group bacterium]
MILIAGLGNPGNMYKNTRHNFGFKVLENITGYNFNKKFNSLISKHQDDLAWLALPQTFMNNSGLAIKKIADYYKIKPKDIWVIHDDIDLQLGKIRINFNRSAAGHHGIESIIKSLKTKEFWRIRLGILGTEKNKIPTDNYVLQKFNAQEMKLVKKAISKTHEALNEFLKIGISSTTYKIS